MRRFLKLSGLVMAAVVLAVLAYWYRFVRTPTTLPKAVLDVFTDEIYSNQDKANDGALFVFNYGSSYFVDIIMIGPSGRADSFYKIEGSTVTKLDHWFQSSHAEIFPDGHIARLCYSKQFRSRVPIKFAK